LCEGRFPESPSSHGSGFHDPSAAGWYAVHGDAAGLSSALAASECFASAGDVRRASAAIEPAKIVVAIRISNSPLRNRPISSKRQEKDCGDFFAVAIDATGFA